MLEKVGGYGNGRPRDRVQVDEGISPATAPRRAPRPIRDFLTGKWR